MTTGAIVRIGVGMVIGFLAPIVLGKTLSVVVFDALAQTFLRCVFLGFSVLFIYLAIWLPWD